MKHTEFNRLTLEIGRAEYPDQQWSIANDRLVFTLPTGQQAEFALSPMYLQAPSGAGVRDWIKERLAMMQNVWADVAYGNWALERTQIYPLLLPAEFLTGVEQKRACSTPEQAQSLPACIDMWHGSLCVSAVVDHPELMVHVSGLHLADWQVNAATVLAQAKANLAQRNRKVIVNRTRHGTIWAQIEPSSYTAAYALLPSFHATLGKALGQRFQILLPAENMLIAHTAPDPWADADFTNDLLEAVLEDGDPGHLLPISGGLNIDLMADTALWQALPAPPMFRRERPELPGPRLH